MENPEKQPSDFSPRTPGELTPEQARQANETFLQGQGMETRTPEYRPSPGAQDPQDGSFLGALFDFSFRRYVTPSVAQVLYMVLFVVIGVAAGLALLGAVSVFFSGQPLGFSLLVFVLAVPPIVLMTVAVLALSRVYLEVAVSLIRTSQSVQAIDARQEQRLRAMEQGQAQNHSAGQQRENSAQQNYPPHLPNPGQSHGDQN